MATGWTELKFNLGAALVVEQEYGDSRSGAMLADKAIREGKAVVDLGCIDSMGGERALDIIARKNMEKYGNRGSPSVNQPWGSNLTVGGAS